MDIHALCLGLFSHFHFQTTSSRMRFHVCVSYYRLSYRIQPEGVNFHERGSSEKNRAQNCLTTCNFKLDDVFSDIFGKSATRVLNALLEQGNGNRGVSK